MTLRSKSARACRPLPPTTLAPSVASRAWISGRRSSSRISDGGNALPLDHQSGADRPVIGGRVAVEVGGDLARDRVSGGDAFEEARHALGIEARADHVVDSLAIRLGLCGAAVLELECHVEALTRDQQAGIAAGEYDGGETGQRDQRRDPLALGTPRHVAHANVCDLVREHAGEFGRVARLLEDAAVQVDVAAADREGVERVVLDDRETVDERLRLGGADQLLADVVDVAEHDRVGDEGRLGADLGGHASGDLPLALDRHQAVRTLVTLGAGQSAGRQREGCNEPRAARVHPSLSGGFQRRRGRRAARTSSSRPTLGVLGASVTCSGVVCGFLCDLAHRGDELVERLERLGLRGLDHQRAGDDQREVDRGRVEALVHQPLGDVRRGDARIVLVLVAQNALVHDATRPRHVVVAAQLLEHVVCVQHGKLGHLGQSATSERADVGERAYPDSGVAEERMDAPDRVGHLFVEHVLVAFAADHGDGQVRGEQVADRDRSGARSTAAVRGRERLVQVEVHDVDAHVAWASRRPSGRSGSRRPGRPGRPPRSEPARATSSTWDSNRPERVRVGQHERGEVRSSSSGRTSVGTAGCRQRRSPPRRPPCR